MAQRATYQLSSETRSDTDAPGFSLIGGLSPIPRKNVRDFGNFSNIENKPFADSEARRRIARSSSVGQLTSTPLVSWRKDAARNGGTFPTNQGTWWKNSSHSLLLNHSAAGREESSYSPDGGPWGTSISPKMRPRAGGVKTVQTVAGPLLASTRYNIDPKVYSDVTSPGLTTRLTKYATEANTKLTHQAQYGTGQFPKVNLYTSPTPMVNTKNGRTRMPVTVRIAPPENIRYGPGERQQIQAESRQDSKSGLSETRTMCKVPLKRPVSRDDITGDLVKKQRTDRIYNGELENLEEMTQKRARDESSRSDEDASPQSVSLRPAKRTKVPSCNDILSSLSSSVNVSSRLKRKALDVSRSGTPDVGKHFKALDSSENEVYLSRSVSEPGKMNKREFNEPERVQTDLEAIRIDARILSDRTLRIGQNSGKEEIGEARHSEQKTEQLCQVAGITSQDRIVKRNSSTVKLTDKLFMKAEPENIDKIKTLIEEHESIKPRFTTDRGEEIKKADIVNMRQTSMKNRLKSMFDAISGKATSKIDPEVVIQAEDKSWSPSQTSTCLSSTTSTTSVNASPISTSVIAPIIGKTKTSTSPTKHVTFQFGNNQTSSLSSSQSAVKIGESKRTEIATPKISTSSAGFASSAEVKKLPPAPTSNVPTGTPQQEPLKSSLPAFSSSGTNFQTSGSAKSAQGSENSQFGTPTTSGSAVTISASSLRSPNSSGSRLFGEGSQATEKKSSTFAEPTKAQTSSSVSLPTSSTGSGFSFPASTTSVTSFAASNNAPPAFPSTTSSSSLFDFGKKTTSETPKSEPGFWVPGSVVASSGGPSNTSLQSNAFGTTTAATTPISATKTSSTTTPGIIFGTTTSSSVTAQPGAFGMTSSSGSGQSSTFGTTTSSSTAPTSSFASANPTATTSQSIFGTNSPGIFGTPNPVTTQQGIFGTSSSATSQQTVFGTTTTPSGTQSSVFGTTGPATTQSSIFGATPSSVTTTQQSLFGTTTNSATTQPSLFGTTTSSATTQQSLFGTTTSSATTQPSMFGTTTSSASQPSLFGSTTTTTSSATAQNVFGTTQSNIFGTTTASTQPIFGTTNSSTTTTTTSANPQPSTFGTPATTRSSIFGAPSTVGFGTTTASFPATSSTTNAFGTTKSETPAFGIGASTSSGLFSNNSSNPTNFGNNFRFPSTPFAGTSTPSFATNSGSLFSPQTTESSSTTSGFSGFSSTSTQSFGTQSTAAPGFGTTNTWTTMPASFGSNSTPAFGTANSSFNATTTTTAAFPSPTFSASSSTSGFGSSSAAPAFGNTSNNASNNFGTNPTQPFTSQAITATPNIQKSFSFGSKESTSSFSAPSATPFNFNNSTLQTGGFDFSGAPAAPSLNFSKDNAPGGSFNIGSGGNMFSIGTGSTAPRSRTSRRRQR